MGRLTRIVDALRAVVLLGSDADAIQRLLDRQAIEACLGRYARGLDRRDRDLVSSAYHPDAVDHHGALGDYGVDGLLDDWEVRDRSRAFSHHLMLNSVVDVDGDMAHGETYFQVVVRLAPEDAGDQPVLSVTGGRYVDRFERRSGEWRIARRVVVPEFKASLDPVEGHPGLLMWSRRTTEDPSYARPLVGPPGDGSDPAPNHAGGTS